MGVGVRAPCAAIAVVLGCAGFVTPAAAQSGFTCTEIIGYSQTREWFTLGAQALAQSGHWQLRAVDGASVDRWASLDFPGWNNSNVTNRCVQGADRPDRVVLDISDDYHTDVNWWVQQGSFAIANIRHNRSSAKQIVLQPVVGGPNGQQCPMGGKINRASFNHPYIDQAIDRLVGGDVLRGPDPTVRSCADYKDDIGHMNDAAAAAVGQSIAQFYTSGAAAPAPAPAPAAAPPPTAQAPSDASSDYCDDGQPPGFDGGFGMLSQMLGDTMGGPMECAHGAPSSGDVEQQTSTGLAFYRASTNTPTFTDGFTHWALTPDGLVTWTGSSIDPP